MKDKWVGVRQRESEAMIQQHRQRREAHKAAWWQEWARQQAVIKLAGGIAVNGELEK